MSKSSRDVGKTRKLKQTTMGQFVSSKSPKKKHKNSTSKMTFWGRSSERDTEEYRKGYPDKKDHEDLDDNARFYLNEIESKPDGDLIEVILKDWWGDYKLLERHHGYIQWLFPIREDGMNWHAQELQKHEIEKINENEEAHARVLKAYKMMLDFYGMELEDDNSGKIKRAENWEDRFKHLNKSFHNYLRITRILKCLGELDYEHLKRPFIEFILHEAMVEDTLPNLLSSCYNYWMDVLRNDSDREKVWKLYETLDGQRNESSDDEKNESTKKPKMKDESENDLQTVNLKASVNEKVNQQEDNNEESTQVYDVLMESDHEENDSSKTLKMKDESENDKKSVNLKESASGKEIQEESKQEDNIDESTQVHDPAVLMETKNEKEINKKPEMKDESENDLNSANLRASEDEKVNEQEVSKQEDNIDESTQVHDSAVLMETKNEKETTKKPEMKDASDNDLNSANLKASVDEIENKQVESKQADNNEESTQVHYPAVLTEVEIEINESCTTLKMKDKSENDLNSANLRASEDEKVKEQEESKQEDKKVKEQEESKQEDNNEESTQVHDRTVLMEAENGSRKELKMKDEPENDIKSVNLNVSENEKLIEQEESTQEVNIEKSAQMDDPDVLMEVENQEAGSDEHEVTKRHHEQSDSEMDDSQIQESVESESVEMTDDSQRENDMPDKQTDSASETSEIKHEQQHSLSNCNSVITIDANQEQNSEENQHNFLEYKSEAKVVDVKENCKLEKDSIPVGNVSDAMK